MAGLGISLLLFFIYIYIYYIGLCPFQHLAKSQKDNESLRLGLCHEVAARNYVKVKPEVVDLSSQSLGCVVVSIIGLVIS